MDLAKDTLERSFPLVQWSVLCLQHRLLGDSGKAAQNRKTGSE